MLKDSKHKKKGSALVVMDSIQAAAAAAGAMCGDVANPLLVVPLSKVCVCVVVVVCSDGGFHGCEQ